MKFISPFIPLLFAALAHASSIELTNDALMERGQPCLAINQSEAESFIAKFASTIDHTGDWKATTKEILAKDFVFASNSYISRNHLPLATGPSYGIAATNRKTYIEQLALLTVSNLTTDDILVTDCGKVIWRANVGSGGPKPYPSKIVGILTLQREKKKKGPEGALVATRWECEFDSIGWSLGLGLDCDTCVGYSTPEGYDPGEVAMQSAERSPTSEQVVSVITPDCGQFRGSSLHAGRRTGATSHLLVCIVDLMPLSFSAMSGWLFK
ncbi:hypothetical protein PRZ48_005966 [Zasmidium cellare]|uniref:NTF2-like domain-containing protein n=1 Tax=Zasmidium cellare TaxID=395010 RepID=A0ABR0EMN6_ZASCE|nr:hypothetical protein PRZ48_005966 [Zasmidium cellare]